MKKNFLKKIIYSVLLMVIVINLGSVDAAEKVTSIELGAVSGAVSGGAIQDTVKEQEQKQPKEFNPDSWKPSSSTEVTGGDKLMNKGNTLVGLIRTIASILSVAVLSVIGIKYMLGSAQEKAEYTKTLKPYFIGAIMVFAITNIIGILLDVFKDFL